MLVTKSQELAEKVQLLGGSLLEIKRGENQLDPQTYIFKEDISGFKEALIKGNPELEIKPMKEAQIDDLLELPKKKAGRPAKKEGNDE